MPVGVTWSGREFARELFSRYGLDYAKHVEADDHVEEPSFSVDLRETRSAMNFVMREDIFSVCAALVEMPKAATPN